MGPSVKFVLPIIDAFPDKKMGVIFCVAKKDRPGGGSEGGFVFRTHFFPSNDSLRYTLLNIAPNDMLKHSE